MMLAWKILNSVWRTGAKSHTPWTCPKVIPNTAYCLSETPFFGHSDYFLSTSQVSVTYLSELARLWSAVEYKVCIMCSPALMVFLTQQEVQTLSCLCLLIFSHTIPLTCPVRVGLFQLSSKLQYDLSYKFFKTQFIYQ